MASKRGIGGLPLVLLGAALATGCVVEAMPESPRGVVVSGPPPQPMPDVRPAPPSPRAVWVAGYWHWTGMQYTWIPGHFEEAPPGAQWRAPHYMLRDGTYFYEPGGWRR